MPKKEQTNKKGKANNPENSNIVKVKDDSWVVNKSHEVKVPINNKSMFKESVNRIFLILSSIIILLVGISSILNYMWMHTYYFEMITNLSWLITRSLICPLIPIIYLVISEKKNISLFILMIFLWLILFFYCYVGLKAELLWNWFFIIPFNAFVIFIVWLIFIVSNTALGWMIKHKIFNIKTLNIFDIFINFWLWLSTFLIVVYVLIMANLLFPYVSWILFVCMCFIIFLERKNLSSYGEVLMRIFDVISLNNLIRNPLSWIPLLLIVFSLAYYYYGFLLAYIPYPTAWDANHAYMFYPKMYALNSWFYWDVPSLMWWSLLWYSYITYWFSILMPFKNSFWIMPDTMAVEMNFLSWVFVLLFWLALIKEFLDISIFYKSEVDDKSDSNSSKISLYLWWGLLLLWLTSWMWAFLVFVDNKTDLWVFTLVILAIYSWSVFFRKLVEKDKTDEQSSESKNPNDLSIKSTFLQKCWVESSILPYIFISWIFFAVAIMSKPTAFLDAVNFGTLLVFVWFGILWALWISLLIIWLLAILDFQWIKDYMSPLTWYGLMGIWIILFWFEKIRWFINKKVRYMLYLLIWGITILLTLLIVKWPFIIYKNYVYWDNISPTDFIRSLILSKNDNLDKASHNKVEKKILLASTWELPLELFEDWSSDDLVSNSELSDTGVILNELEPIDISSIINNQVSFENCIKSTVWVTDKDSLYAWIYTWASNWYSEDVWRYVWYWWKPEIAWNKMNWVFPDIKSWLKKNDDGPSFRNPIWWFLFPWYDKCYWFNKSSNIICENMDIFENINMWKIELLLKQLPKDSKWYELVTRLLNDPIIKWFSMDEISKDREKFSAYIQRKKDIDAFYKDNSIRIEKTCMIPNEKQYEWKSCDEINPLLKTYVKDIYVPYKYLVPFNISFNWSLQNTSSYYTDIWYIWIVWIMLIIIGFVYWLITKERLLSWISFVTLAWWMIWSLIWWWILWYGMWLVMWTILSVSVFFYHLFLGKVELNRFLWIWLILIFSVMWFRQLILNFVRIDTQWWSWAFVWYKEGAWIDYMARFRDSNYDELSKLWQNIFVKENVLVDSQKVDELYTVCNSPLNAQQRIQFKHILSKCSIIRWLHSKSPYYGMDVFELQFPHYKTFVHASNNRDTDNEWIYLAWTYGQYFIENQRNIMYDQFLHNFYTRSSDNNICKTYQRLKDQKIKYIVIDPNIGTVVMWEWNMSLFNRFFAKIDEFSGKIQEHGTLTMMAELFRNWYVEYLSSNNLWSIYAFTVSDDIIRKYYGSDLEWDSLLTTRARLAIPRFWSNRNEIISNIVWIFNDRLVSWEAIKDLADMQWKIIDRDKLTKLTSEIIKDWKLRDNVYRLNDQINALSLDERYMLTQFIWLRTYYYNNKSIYDQQITDMVQSSIDSSSQIVALKVK